LSFPSSFVGTKYYWQQIKDQSNATSNWQQIAGSVTINPPPPNSVAFSRLSPQGCATGGMYLYNDNSPVTICGQTSFVINIVSCSVSPSQNMTLQTQITGSYTLQVQVTANTNAAPGARTLACTFNTSSSLSFSTSLMVWDITPRIDSITPNPITYPDTTPVTFTGAGFGVAAPTLQFSPGGVTYSIAPGNTPSSFIANITPPAPGDYSVMLTSAGEGGNGFQSGGQTPSKPQSVPVNLQALQPSISGNPGIWWFGASFVPNGPDAPGYYDSTLLTVSSTGIFLTTMPAANWVVNPPEAQQYVSLTCAINFPPCSGVILKVTGPPTGCTSLSVQASLGAVTSPAFQVVIDQPQSASFVSVVDFGTTTPPGYLSSNTLAVRSSCQQLIASVSAHEEFTSAWTPCGGSTGWDDAVPLANWGTWTTTPFVDTVADHGRDETKSWSCPVN
jgi:hypothetical protein